MVGPYCLTKIGWVWLKKIKLTFFKKWIRWLQEWGWGSEVGKSTQGQDFSYICLRELSIYFEQTGDGDWWNVGKPNWDGFILFLLSFNEVCFSLLNSTTLLSPSLCMWFICTVLQCTKSYTFNFQLFGPRSILSISRTDKWKLGLKIPDQVKIKKRPQFSKCQCADACTRLATKTVFESEIKNTAAGNNSMKAVVAGLQSVLNR